MPRRRKPRRCRGIYDASKPMPAPAPATERSVVRQSSPTKIRRVYQRRPAPARVQQRHDHPGVRIPGSDTGVAQRLTSSPIEQADRARGSHAPRSQDLQPGGALVSLHGEICCQTRSHSASDDARVQTRRSGPGYSRSIALDWGATSSRCATPYHSLESEHGVSWRCCSHAAGAGRRW